MIVEGWGALSGRLWEALVSWFGKFLDRRLFWGGLGHTPNLPLHPTHEVMVFLCLDY